MPNSKLQDIQKLRPIEVKLAQTEKVVEEEEKNRLEKEEKKKIEAEVKAKLKPLEAVAETVLEAGVLPTNIPIKHSYPTVEFLEKKEKARLKKRKKDKVDVEYSIETDYAGGQMPINKGYWNHKVMIGTPTTGVVRMEWVLSRYGQIIPTNWSMMDSYMLLPHMFAPMRYLVPDAQNLIVKNVLEKKVEWLFLIEQDNVIPPDCFVKMNEYMRKADIPIISGLYFTKSVPPEPMIYRGLGNSFFRDWKLGERVWCTGIPTGCVIIHSSILQVLWDESPEYSAQGQITRRVFENPEEVWYDPETGGFRTNVGTSDLQFCKRVMTEDIFTKAGWPEYQKKSNPFLVDTSIFVKHIDMESRMFPLSIPEEYLPAVSPRDNR